MIRSFIAALALAAATIASPAMAKTLTVGANVGNVPWEFQDEKGEIVGFEIELVKEVAKRLGYDDVQVENIPFNGLFSAVQSNRIDVAVSSITITKKRLESVSFAQPYYDSDQSLSVLASSGIKSQADLKGKVLGVDTGSTGDMYATEHQKETGVSEIRRFEGLAPAMLDLGNGGIDGYISDIPAVAYYIKDKPQYAVVERIKTGEQYSMMFAKDSPLAAQASEAISALKKEGFLSALHKKWFGTEADAATSTATVADMPKL
ncbi:transporter substrate-binding domain-containing protein [Mesorhizobium sp. RP14(2022)]|jgi:polar amino acid transport system substrate-binding protein|uniref:Transporter substrate-binding domain-containing protein n=1 Tax=Mesorhizobium liriopis TaxID=2953882 RepID=A0ABT1C3T9_9HYPH|nr:transporter substrate-binding domain-containing protein [Mesorhizobium liriopis]MCO6049496.1 transporter substrate-binding domain-containing protein [Mesorhizobium liriopis]